MFTRPKKQPKTALVLGGGGARGIAHIGVLKVLERENIPIDMVVGTSAGALIGGAYCQLTSAQAVEDRLIQYIQSDNYKASAINRIIKKQDPENFFGQIATRWKERIIINMAQSRKGLLKRNRLQSVINSLLENKKIEDTRIPFAAVAVDLISAKEVVCRKGNIRHAVEASSALPGYFAPFEQNGKLLVDGAVLQVIPIQVARKLGAEFIIAVNVTPDLSNDPDLENVINIVFRASSITTNRYNRLILKDADIVLSPRVGFLHWSDFDRYQEVIELGEYVANQAVPKIRNRLQSKKKILDCFRSSTEPEHIEIEG